MAKKLSEKESSVSESSPKSQNSGGIFSSKIFQVVLFVIVIAAIAAAAFFYIQYINEKRKADQLVGKNVETPAQVQQLISQVGKLIELPTGEAPTVATVSDVKKLAGQPFFANAQNGDKVLLYAKAQKGILYRPSINKIINVAPLNINAPTGSPSAQGASPSAAVSKTVSAVILNGTSKIGLTATAEAKLAGLDVKVVDRDNAKKRDYTDTLVIDLTNKNSSITSQIIKAVGGKSSTLPAGEVAPKDTDVLIILGSDFAAK